MIHLWKKLSFLFPSRYTVITSLFFSPTARHLLHTAFVCSTTPRNPPHHSRAAQWNASNHVPCSDPAAPRERSHHGHGGWDHHGNVSRWVQCQQGFVSVELSCEPRGSTAMLQHVLPQVLLTESHKCHFRRTWAGRVFGVSSAQGLFLFSSTLIRDGGTT